MKVSIFFLLFCIRSRNAVLVLPYGGRRELIRTLIDKNHVWLRQKTWHDSIKAILGYDVHVLRTISNTPKGREYLT